MKSKLIGKKIKIVSGEDYLGCTGTIEYCNSCCRKLRIQFDGMGNNELWWNFKKHLIYLD